jgi:hypothetical protein
MMRVKRTGKVMQIMKGSPRPEMRSGELVIDERLRPGIIADDEIRNPIRKVSISGVIEEAWAASLVIADEDEFEMALVLREVGEKP